MEKASVSRAVRDLPRLRHHHRQDRRFSRLMFREVISVNEQLIEFRRKPEKNRGLNEAGSQDRTIAFIALPTELSILSGAEYDLSGSSYSKGG